MEKWMTPVLMGLLAAGLLLVIWRQAVALRKAGRSLRAKEDALRETTARLAARETALELQEKQVVLLQGQLVTQFEQLATKILDAQTRTFTQDNRQQMDRLLRPLGEQLNAYRQAVEATHVEQTKQSASLEERIRQLMEQTQSVSTQANNLAQALTGQSKTQGTWGEVILERILEQSGLVRDTHYTVQESFRDTEGQRFQPDVIIHLPDQRTIIIDSKSSLVAYEKWNAETQEELRATYLHAHIAALRKHVDELAAKPYPEYTGSLHFVMMFVPVEPAYLIAIQNDKALWEYAYAKRVLLISPTNLIACLKLISDLWTREMQNRNALEIARRGELLLTKFALFADSMKAIGTALDRSSEAYARAMNQLSEGNGNLMTQAQQLKELGVKASKTL